MTTPVVQMYLDAEAVKGLPAIVEGATLYNLANQQAAFGQSMTVDPTTGYASLAGDSVPNQIAGGVASVSELSDTSTTSGNARTIVSWGTWEGRIGSTIANDNFTIADLATPFWYAGPSTPGKLSHTGTTFAANLLNRSCGGLVLGLDPGSPIGGPAIPRVWEGPIAQRVALAAHLEDNFIAGSVAYPVDSGATVDIGSTSAATAAVLMPRAKVHGVLTSIEITPSAALAATSGNDRTITFWKIDTLGVNAAVNVGTFTTTTALVAQVSALFTLSAVAGALNMLETDILGYSTVHASSGAIIPQSAIRANMKVV